MGTWFKDRLNYLSARMSGRAGWTDVELDFVPIVYFKGGFLDDGSFPVDAGIQLKAQVGRSQSELLMSDGLMTQSMDRDYFIFDDDLGFRPEEGDIILDANYQRYYSKVSTRFTRATHTHTNETSKRMRVRTVVIHSGGITYEVPDLHATYLRSDGTPVGAAYQPPRFE